MSLLSGYIGARRTVGRIMLHLLALGVTGYLIYDGWRLGDPVQIALGIPAFFMALFLCFKATLVTLTTSLAIWGGLFGISYYLHEQDSKAFRPIAALVKNIALADRSERPISLPGRVIIWDVRTNELSAAHYRLPYALRAKPDDQCITVFMLWNVHSEKVWNYHNRSPESSLVKIDAAGFRDTADFAVVRWPEQQLISWHSLAGALPPKEITISRAHAHDPVHGGWETSLVEWIAYLPGGENAETAPPHRWTEAEAQAEAVRRYPQLGLASSPMNHAFLEKYQQLKASDSSQLKDPTWPLHLARDLAQ